MSASNNKTFLIVDDDEVFCEALSRAFIRRGFNVYTAFNVESAVNMAADNVIDYAVIDLRIGEESGLFVVKEFNKIRPEIKMVVLTGYASIATTVEAIKLGASHYLTKPAQADDILESLNCLSGNDNVVVPTKPMSVQRLEWEHIQSVLAKHDGNVSAAARALGMHRRTLQRKLQKRPTRL